MFCLIECEVSPLERRLIIAVLGVDRAQPDADGDRDLLAAGVCGRVCDTGSNAFGQRLCILDRCVGQQNDEFLPADPGCDVDAPRLLLHRLRDMLQHHIAGGMTPGVIDPLEVIDIDGQQAAAQARIALHALVFDRQALKEGAPVGQARQLVGGGLGAQFMGEQHLRGDVFEGGIDLLELAVFEQRNRVDPEPGKAPIGYCHAHDHIVDRLERAGGDHGGMLCAGKVAAVFAYRFPARVD